MQPEDKLWAKRRTVLTIFELPVRKLDNFVLEGWVRTAKLGNCKQSARLYNIDDVRATLNALARNANTLLQGVKEELELQ